MWTLEADGFEPALLERGQPWLRPQGGTPVLACGMVGARQGWVEAAYRKVPCPPVGDPLTRRPRDRSADRGPHRSRPVARTQARPDVMRGEETQLAGLLHRRPDFDGVACLPGTHSKWARAVGRRGHQLPDLR